MEIKKFLRDPQQVIKELKLAPKDELAQALLRQAEHINAERRQLKLLKVDKAQVARAFKSAVSGSEQHSELIRRMQEVSEACKPLQESIRTREQSLRKLLSGTRADSGDFLPPLYRIASSSSYLGAYEMRELRADERDLWFRFVAQQPNVPVYCRAAWAEVIASSFGHPIRVWAALSPKGDILGGVPLIFFDSRLFGRFAVSMPYVNYGGVISPWIDVAQALLHHLADVCRAESLSHIEIRTMQPGLLPWALAKKVSMILPLPDSEAALDQQLGSKIRAQCKKAAIHAPEIRYGKQELLEDFYRVFAINMRDLGTPVYSRRWFASILCHPDIDSTLAVVYVQGRAVSAGFLVGHGSMLEIPWASTLRSANGMNTNMWMYRQILDFAVRQGYGFFDFGRSTVDAGTYRFKKQWGAQSCGHYWYYLLPEGGAMPELNPDNPRYKLLIGIWQRLPVCLTNIIGPPLVKNLP